MSPTHVALLRGINVGRAKRVAMADLRALVAGLGYREPRTLLNSGNVVFTAPRVAPATAARRLERALADELGLTSRVTVLTAAELDAVLAADPLAEVATDPSRLQVAVLADPADRGRLAPLAERDWAPEALAVGPRAAWLWCPAGTMGGQLAEAVSRALGEGVTVRNAATMRRIQAALHEAPAR